MVRYIVVLACLVTLHSCGGKSLKELVTPVSVKTPGGSTSQRYTELRWPSNYLPVVIVAPSSMRPQIETSLFSICQTWNTATGIPLVSYRFENFNEEIPNTNSLNDGAYKLYFQNNWSNVSQNNQALAVTFYRYYDNNSIFEADIVFNKSFNFFYSDVAGSPVSSVYLYDFESVLLHEVGHLLGLDHFSDDESSVMYPFLSNGQTQRDLSPSDISNIINKYN